MNVNFLIIHFLNRGSKFIAFQEIRVQETQDQVPAGNIPRNFTVLAKGQLTRKCFPGDLVVIQGVYLPSHRETFTGLKTSIKVKKFIKNVKNIIFLKKRTLILKLFKL